MKKKTPLAHNKQIRILIADDHPVVREGLAGIIKVQPDMQLVGESENGRKAVRDYFDLHPDVVLLDVRMPEMDGIAATSSILKRDPQANVIALSTYQGEEDVYLALKAGAKGYLLKDAPRRDVANCIRSVQEGNICLSPSVATKLAAKVTAKPLTKRETEIIKQLATGKSNKEIAAQLKVAEGTIKIHLGHIFDKLGASGRTEAIRIALQRGLVHISPE